MRAKLVAVSTGCLIGALALGWTYRSILWPNSKLPSGAVFLPSGMRISPVGQQFSLAGDMPLQMALSGDGQKLIVVTGGYHDHGVSTIDLAAQKVESTIPIGKCTSGLAIVDDGHAAVSSADIGIQLVDFAASHAAKLGQPENKAWYGSVVKLPDGNFAASDLNHDKVLKIDPATGAAVATQAVGYRPCALAVSPKGDTLAAAEWGAGTVSLLNASDLKPVSTLKAGSHPNSLAFAKDGTLYIANGGSDTVTVARDGNVVSTVFVSPNAHNLLGSTPDALAVSPDNRTLYVANADANCVAVVDVSNPAHPKVSGFIPTGWYPSALCCSADGKKLYIGVGKGLSSRENKNVLGKNKSRSYDQKFTYEYIGYCLSGLVSVVDVPDKAALANHTKLVVDNVRRQGASEPTTEQETEGRAALKNIKHVVYVIRENRTYDQVFGDLSGTNADPSITMYGETVTPNAHAIVRRWVALDNIYCDGEVSQDGHQWCCASYVSDFTEHAWQTSYSGRGQPDADDRLTTSPFGYIWDNCRKHGKSYRSYGEFSSFKSDPDKAPVFTGNKGLQGHASEAWSQQKGRDYQRIDTFIDEMHQAEQTDSWPQFMVMSLGEDHTSGLTAKRPTPFASVASNDQAVGKMIDAISHSKFWKDTAVFIIEDDAQNGADHVDCHRTVAMVISPYLRKGVVDSTMYCTGSLVRTMELILGLPPMNAHDASATPMYACFTTKPDFAPYSLLAAQTDLQAMNPDRGEGARLSRKLDLDDYDRADPALFNRLLWQNAHPGVPEPQPVHASFATER